MLEIIFSVKNESTKDLDLEEISIRPRKSIKQVRNFFLIHTFEDIHPYRTGGERIASGFRHSSVDSSAPSIQLPQDQVPSKQSSIIYSKICAIFVLELWKNENKQKEVRFGPFKKTRIVYPPLIRDPWLITKLLKGWGGRCHQSLNTHRLLLSKLDKQISGDI